MIRPLVSQPMQSWTKHLMVHTVFRCNLYIFSLVFLPPTQPKQCHDQIRYIENETAGVFIDQYMATFFLASVYGHKMVSVYKALIFLDVTNSTSFVKDRIFRLDTKVVHAWNYVHG